MANFFLAFRKNADVALSKYIIVSINQGIFRCACVKIKIKKQSMINLEVSKITSKKKVALIK